MRRGMLVLSVFMLGLACAHPGTDTTKSTDRSVLTRDEINRGQYRDLYDAVSALRRNWLQTRGADSFNNPSVVRVYLDNVALGGTDALRNIVPASVVYLKFYDGIAATTRWGTDHGAGVIFVSSRPAAASPN
jgi:hypothetical protein